MRCSAKRRTEYWRHGHSDGEWKVRWHPRTIGYRMSLDETLDIGEDTGTPVSEDYEVPFKFTGENKKVVIELK